MRILRSLALALMALAAPLMRGAAQTCQGMSAFQDGRVRVGGWAHENSDISDIGASFTYGIPRSFYGEIGFDKLQLEHGGSSATGPGVTIGYQIHLSDTPFQICPEATAHYYSSSEDTFEYGFGGTLGYRVDISDWFSLVPAAGVRWVNATGISDKVDLVGGGGSQSLIGTPVAPRGNSSDVRMEIGLVFNKALTVVPGLLVPSQNGTKSIFTIGVSINWANAVPR